MIAVGTRGRRIFCSVQSRAMHRDYPVFHGDGIPRAYPSRQRSKNAHAEDEYDGYLPLIGISGSAFQEIRSTCILLPRQPTEHFPEKREGFVQTIIQRTSAYRVVLLRRLVLQSFLPYGNSAVQYLVVHIMVRLTQTGPAKSLVLCPRPWSF